MADTKVSALTGFTPVGTDVLYGVDDPGGTPASGKFTVADLFGAAGIEMPAQTVTVSTPLVDTTQTWNDAAVAFTALKVNVTDTASLKTNSGVTGSALLDLQQGGTSLFKVNTASSGVSGRTSIEMPQYASIIAANGRLMFGRSTTYPNDTTMEGGMKTCSVFGLRWTSGSTNGGGLAEDTGLYRDAAGVVKATTTSISNLGGMKAAYHEAGQAYTVATLPTGVVGMMARVTDADTPAVGSTVTGGAAAAALVWYNGSNWTVMGI